MFNAIFATRKGAEYDLKDSEEDQSPPRASCGCLEGLEALRNQAFHSAPDVDVLSLHGWSCFAVQLMHVISNCAHHPKWHNAGCAHGEALRI